MQALYSKHNTDGAEELNAKLKGLERNIIGRKSDVTGDLTSPKNQETIGAAGGKIVMIGCDLCFYADETTTRVISEWHGTTERRNPTAKKRRVSIASYAKRRIVENVHMLTGH